MGVRDPLWDYCVVRHEGGPKRYMTRAEVAAMLIPDPLGPPPDVPVRQESAEDIVPILIQTHRPQRTYRWLPRAVVAAHFAALVLLIVVLFLLAPWWAMLPVIALGAPIGKSAARCEARTRAWVDRRNTQTNAPQATVTERAEDVAWWPLPDVFTPTTTCPKCKEVSAHALDGNHDGAGVGRVCECGHRWTQTGL